MKESIDDGINGSSEESKSIEQANSVAEINATLAQLKSRETAVTTALNKLISGQKDLARELGKLDLIRAQLGSQSVATRSISSNMLSDAASTAQRISGAVNRLDLEQMRVRETLAVVEQVAELKACVLGVNGSMGAPQDWEMAAGYLNRASKIPDDIVSGAFAEEIVPSAEVPDPPRVTLENAAESLCGLFLREFEKAAREDDGAKVTRFFKLFPLIGRSQVGLDVYGRFVCQGVAAHARGNLNAGTGGAQRKEGFFYANALTKLFEYIAQIVERHGGLVERHYGRGRMVRVIERLQAEADVQGGIVIDTWSEERNIDRKLTDIKSYAFTFLVQSFMSSQPSKGPRSGSPAAFDKARRSMDEESIDMKEVDGFLNEIGVMIGRWSLYCRFLAAKCQDDTEDQALVIPPLLLHSNLYKKVAERLIIPFNVMTTFYFRRSVEKAFQLDEQPADLSLNMNKIISSHAPYITSAVDDVMYIVDQVVQRALATSQREVIVSVIPTIARVLGSDFVGMIQRKMRDESYPKPLVQGGFPAEHTIVAFLVLINNLDIATEYIKRIVNSHLESPTTTASESTRHSLSESFPFGHDATTVQTTLASLRDTLDTKATELLKEGIYVVFKNVAKPRLRSILADTFRDADYSLSSPDSLTATTTMHSAASTSPPSTPPPPDAIPTRFRPAWDALARPLARLLTPASHARLLALLLPALAEALEKRIWAYHARVAGALGAARLERDVARIAGIAVQGAPWAARDAFVRCAQICAVMAMEEDEWEEQQQVVLAGLSEEEGNWKKKKKSEAEEVLLARVVWRIDRDEMERARAMVRW